MCFSRGCIFHILCMNNAPICLPARHGHQVTVLINVKVTVSRLPAIHVPCSSNTTFRIPACSITCWC